MPMVNGIKYPYTESGKRCAAAAASEMKSTKPTKSTPKPTKK
jgi:hypothetical protein